MHFSNIVFDRLAVYCSGIVKSSRRP